MYLQHFGLTHPPLGKELTEPWDDGALAHLAQRFDWLLKSPGIGLLTVWLVGHPALAHTLERAPYAALASRIQLRVTLKPVIERERFTQLIAYALKSAGCQHTLLADSGMEILRQASKGLPRQAGRILCTAMRLAVPRGLNHLPDELLQQAIAELQ